MRQIASICRDIGGSLTSALRDQSQSTFAKSHCTIGPNSVPAHPPGEPRRNQAPYFTVPEKHGECDPCGPRSPTDRSCGAPGNGLHVGLQKGFWKLSLAI